jgi:hypothetical protein
VEDAGGMRASTKDRRTPRRRRRTRRTRRGMRRVWACTTRGGMTGLLQDPHPHINLGAANSFSLV